MLEHIDLKQSVAKDDYKQRLPPLQERLYDLQGAVFRARVPVAIVLEGWAAAGIGITLSVLAERLDPRGFRVVPITPPRTFELAYPWLWRFWLKIPAYGQIVVYDTSWYRRVLIDRITRQVSQRKWQAAYEDIHDFESELAADGTVILKFWLHISKKEQAARFKKLRAHKLTAWQVSDEDLAEHEAYKHYLAAVEEMLARTEAPHAPWTIVPATNRYFARLKVLETIVQALEFRLRDQPPPPAAPPAGPAPELNSAAGSPSAEQLAPPAADAPN
jgi:AMP-polyphosphate phosphotransferase